MQKTKPYSSMLFWAKYIALALTIVIIAVLILTSEKSTSLGSGSQGQSKSKNLSDNMTKFYEQYRQSSPSVEEEELGDFVMELKAADKPLGERLKKMESLQKPLAGNWAGDHKHRSFAAGSTLRGAITDYAQSEGMQLIWELDKDFIVKYQFQLDDSIAGSLRAIARAIDSSFEGTVRAFICPKQRSLVITATNTHYLQENCQEVQK